MTREVWTVVETVAGCQPVVTVLLTRELALTHVRTLIRAYRNTVGPVATHERHYSCGSLRVRMWNPQGRPMVGVMMVPQMLVIA